MVDLLCAHGLPADVAHKIYVESGGIPALARSLAGAVRATPSLLGRPTPLPTSLERVLRDGLLAQPADVRETLRYAALLHRPTVRELERAGRAGADEDLRRAGRAGLVAPGDGTVRFTPPRLRALITETVPPAERAELHRRLATAAPTQAQRLRHRALAEPAPTVELAHDLGLAACDAAEGGAREIAAERVEWLATAVETAAPGNHVELLNRGLTGFLETRPTPAQAARARSRRARRRTSRPRRASPPRPLRT